MATTQAYKVLYDNINVKSSASLLSSTLGKLKKDTVIEVLDIRGLWAHFKYNNKDAYVITLYLQKVEQVITGIITIKYINVDTNAEVLATVTNNNLSLNVYSRTAPYLEGYTVLEPSVKSVTLTKSNPNQDIIFYYKENVIYGSITVNYIDKSTNLSILEPKVNKDLNLGTYSYNAMEVAGYKIMGDSSKSITLTKDAKDQIINFEYEKYITENDIYIIDLKKYGISNDNTNGNSTTLGINKALADAKAAAYKRVQLPEGIYSIDTSVKNPIVLSDGTNNWTHNRQGICMLSDMELILEGATLQMIPCEDPYYSIVTISNCKNSKITGGTILGDRDTHDYGMRIEGVFESGDFDSTTGEPKVDDTKVRTKDFIEVYKDWFTGKEEPLPTNFYIIPLWNTTMNTVDGGFRYIYCYDKDNNYLGILNSLQFIDQATVLKNTAKIKLSLRGEKRLDVAIAMTKRSVYYTYEFGSGLTVTASKSIEIKGTTIKNCIGDCIYTTAPPLKVTVDNLSIIDCTLENSRRQGISFVATGENYLVQGCNIGKINGVDPQCGIDFEHYDYMKNTVIDRCNFYDNKKWDIINYNGTDIEIKNSNFTGAIATTYGHSMDIHHNQFQYKDSTIIDKYFKDNSLTLTSNNNKVHDNTFLSGSVTNSGENSITYDNVFRDNAKPNITNNGINKYYNCSVGITPNSLFKQLDNNYFENCNVFYNNKGVLGVDLNNCIFEQSSFNPTGISSISNCIFNLKDKILMDNWKPAGTNVTFRNCKFNSTYNVDTQLLGKSLNILATFENCNFNISRYKLALSYGTLTFNTCNFIFNNLNTDPNRVTLTESGYGYEKCPWYFNNCSFKTNYPVYLGGANVINSTIYGDVIYL